VNGFCRFLADGNEKSEEGRRVGEQLAAAGDTGMLDDFMHGERYLKDAGVTQRFLQSMPIQDIPKKYVVVKPLDQIDPQRDDVKSVTVFGDPNQLSALVVLANYTDSDRENFPNWYATNQTSVVSCFISPYRR
jgi:hypothetical protein